MSLDPSATAGLGTVRVVGTGLLGTSVALALRDCGVPVVLSDTSPTALALARDLGAGEPDAGDRVCAMVVVAAPPDVTAQVVAAELDSHPEATVTDVASVKSTIRHRLEKEHAPLQRYVGGHPMAGLERSGPVAARADLFIGRPWVVCPTPASDPERVVRVRRLAQALGAAPVTMDAVEHDAAVALTSHVPQLLASLVAGRLRQAPEASVALAGQGLRDVTRIAAGDPMLWAQILAANAGPVLDVLLPLRADLESLTGALEQLALAENTDVAGAEGARAAVARAIADGNAGYGRIPGKHGSPPTRYAVVTALVPDRPGELARLLADIGEEGINLEELALEHAPGMAVGLAVVSVLPAVREGLERALTARGWHLVS
jgi:prephenate dehydrogenase